MREAKSFGTFEITKLYIYNHMNINIKIKKKRYQMNINLLGTDLVLFGTPLYSYGYAQKIGAVPNGTKVKICVLVP